MNGMQTLRRGRVWVLAAAAALGGGCAASPDAEWQRPMADPVTLRGEAMAPTPPPVFAQIPAGSELSVRVVDTAYRDEAAGEIGAYRGPALGWPLKFEVAYDRSLVRPARVYSIEARVRANGRLLYENASYVPLSPNPAETVKIPMRKAPE